MKKTLFRLSEYLISEYENGLLWWETHHGFGEQRSGQCYIRGDILIIGHWRHEEIGYLKGEFLDQLNKLPPWSKTTYYCFAFELLEVGSGLNLKEDSLKRMLLENSFSADPKAFSEEGPGAFRIDKYKITVGTNGRISWQALGENNQLAEGQCIIQSGILFIGPEESGKEELCPREFKTELEELPQWNRTRIWGRSSVLRHCQPQFQRGSRAVIKRSGQEQGERTLGEELHRAGRYLQGEPGKKPLSLGFKLPKPSWPVVQWKKAWFKYLIPLILVGLLLALILSFHWIEERFHQHHGHDDHNRTHRTHR